MIIFIAIIDGCCLIGALLVPVPNVLTYTFKNLSS